jgi:hypothetical protein
MFDEQRYISRLESVQFATTTHMESMGKKYPRALCNVLTFGSGVSKVKLDGSEERIDDAEKMELAALVAKGGSLAEASHVLGENSAKLSESIWALREGGQTALGPALVLAVAIASQKPFSRVVISTDGVANIGVGTLENLSTKEERAEAERFYEEVGSFAQSCGVTIDLFTYVQCTWTKSTFCMHGV